MRAIKVCSLIIGLAIISFDQIIKFIVSTKVPASGIFVLGSNIKLETVLNQNIAFGFALPKVLVFVLILVALVLINYLLMQARRQKQHLDSILLSIIFYAAVSNLIDRIFLGGVVDYLSITIYNFTWPTFNLADCLIVVACIIFALNQFKNKDYV